MFVRYSDWVRPTDGAYAFPLQPCAPERPLEGTRSDIGEVARSVMGDESAERFARRVRRWSGPEDERSGARPLEAPQETFVERDGSPLGRDDVETVLAGDVLVLREESGATDYVLRDHHMLDVVLYHYRTTGELPEALFHADRHSDWCTDAYLEQRVPDQAATWWMLLRGLKRPESDTPVLEENQVHFATARAEHEPWMSGRPEAGSVKTPWFLDTGELGWRHALEREGALASDWVSLDLDYFQPSPQLRLSKGLLRDERFRRLSAEAKVRVFCLSPQFTNGGDRFSDWTVQGRMSSSLRLVNWLRRRD